MADTFAEYLVGLFPTFLRGRWGRLWGEKHGAAADLALDGAKDAVRAGFVASAPADALPHLVADSALLGLPGETADQRRERIAGAWEVWAWAGTRHGLEVVAGQLGFEHYRLKTSADFAPGLPPGHRADLWARWWLFVYAHPWTRTEWGAATWGSGTWGSSATAADVARVKGALRTVTNARDRGTVRLFFGGTTSGGWGLGTWGGGKWGDAGTSFIDWTVE